MLREGIQLDDKVTINIVRKRENGHDVQEFHKYAAHVQLYKLCQGEENRVWLPKDLLTAACGFLYSSLQLLHGASPTGNRT